MNLAAVAHCLAAGHLHPGGVAVDATVGNGHDTQFLANQVGPGGHVHGFDIQQQALSATTRRLSQANLLDRVTLHRTGHEHLRKTLPGAVHGKVTVAMFNLGYLPGGDHSITTSVTSTLPALTQGLAVLAPRGLLLVTLYAGHPGGDQEANSVTQWARHLDPAQANTAEYRLLNHSPKAPRLLVIERVSHCAS